VSSVKALLSVMRDDSAIARVRAPLQPLSEQEARALARKAAEVRQAAA
jgi:hypothetical protein